MLPVTEYILRIRPQLRFIARELNMVAKYGTIDTYLKIETAIGAQWVIDDLRSRILKEYPQATEDIFYLSDPHKVISIYKNKGMFTFEDQVQLYGYMTALTAILVTCGYYRELATAIVAPSILTYYNSGRHRKRELIKEALDGIEAELNPTLCPIPPMFQERQEILELQQNSVEFNLCTFVGTSMKYPSSDRRIVVD